MDKMRKFYKKLEKSKNCKSYDVSSETVYMENHAKQHRTSITAYLSKNMEYSNNALRNGVENHVKQDVPNTSKSALFWSDSESDECSLPTSGFKGFSASNIEKVSEVDFALSDSEYESLKNERTSNSTFACNAKQSVKQTHCDSTTDIHFTAKRAKEISPEPKISTTVKSNSLHNGYETSVNNYKVQKHRKQFVVPFKKRYVQSYMDSEETDESNNPPTSLSNTEVSVNNTLGSPASSVDNMDPDEDNLANVVSIIKVKLWKVDFNGAYNNDYVDFNEERCLILQDKITEEKKCYENATRLNTESECPEFRTCSEITPPRNQRLENHTKNKGKRKNSSSESNVSHLVEVYDGFRVQLSEEHLKTLSIHSRHIQDHQQEPGCSFQSIACGGKKIRPCKSNPLVPVIQDTSSKRTFNPNCAEMSTAKYAFVSSTNSEQYLSNKDAQQTSPQRKLSFNNQIIRNNVECDSELVAAASSWHTLSPKKKLFNPSKDITRTFKQEQNSNEKKANFLNAVSESKIPKKSKLKSSMKWRKHFDPTPLSPETTKRNEFYSYLQISTKPRLRSDGTPIEPNRRSVRVRNIELNKIRERSLSTESHSTSNIQVIAEDILEKKPNIKKIFAKPKTKKKKSKFLLRKDTKSNHKLLKSLPQISPGKWKLGRRLKKGISSSIQTRKTSINLRSNRKLPYRSTRFVQNRLKNCENVKIATSTSSDNEKMFKQKLKSDSIHSDEENSYTRGFSVADRKVANHCEEILTAVNNDLNNSLKTLQESLVDTKTENIYTNSDESDEKYSHQLKNPKVEPIVTRSDHKIANKQKILWDHINGPMTRHSHAAINKTLTRSSRIKIPKLNLDAVMKRMRRRHKAERTVTRPTQSTSSSIRNNLKNTQNSSQVPDNTNQETPLIDQRLEISNSPIPLSENIDQFNSEALNVQNNVVELSTQQYLNNSSNNSSHESEYSFRGFGSPVVAESGSSISETDSENSGRYFVRNPRRRYSLPTYLGNELQDKYNNLLMSSNNPSFSEKFSPICTITKLENTCIENCPKCESESQEESEPSPVSHENAVETELSFNSDFRLPSCSTTDVFHTEELKETTLPMFIPISPLPARSFNQTFNKKSFMKLDFNHPCLFGSESNHQLFDVMMQAWNTESLPEDCSSVSTLRPSVQVILSNKHEKQQHVTTAKRRIDQHGIDITECDGCVLDIQFLSSTLIVVQEYCISFWQQTPLGMMLGSQNMWLRLGKVQRLTLEQGCVNKRAMAQSVTCVDNDVVYIELWTKEHKSEKRERPISDVFATVYFYQQKGNILDKKVLQLENIKGFSQDVQYISLKNSRSILVSWRDQFASPPKSNVRRYTLAVDFQTLANVAEIASVDHYIMSLHNVVDCSEMVLGIGHQQVSVWHLPHGKLVTTVTINNPPSSLLGSIAPLQNFNCIWAMCDRGFLFLIQKTENNLLQLIAINGLKKDWKQLQLYRVPSEYTDLLDVCVESGVLSACYRKGLVCWSLQSGTMLLECPSGAISLFPSQTRISFVDEHFNVGVKHVTAFLLED